MARNRHSWEKRAKELARKEKKAEKIKRRQSNKTPTPPAEEQAEGAEEETQKSTSVELAGHSGNF